MKNELAGSGARISSGAQTVEGLFEHAAELDRDCADIDLEAVDLLGRGAPAEPVLVVDDEGMQPAMGETRRGAQPAGASSDHHSIDLMSIHAQPPSMPPDWFRRAQSACLMMVTII
ncbi:hypothetical protein ACVWW1_004183 [Bradyrhizobium sp. JR3.5]